MIATVMGMALCKACGKNSTIEKKQRLRNHKPSGTVLDVSANSLKINGMLPLHGSGRTRITANAVSHITPPFSMQVWQIK